MTPTAHTAASSGGRPLPWTSAPAPPTRTPTSGAQRSARARSFGPGGPVRTDTIFDGERVTGAGQAVATDIIEAAATAYARAVSSAVARAHALAETPADPALSGTTTP